MIKAVLQVTVMCVFRHARKIFVWMMMLVSPPHWPTRWIDVKFGTKAHGPQKNPTDFESLTFPLAFSKQPIEWISMTFKPPSSLV